MLSPEARTVALDLIRPPAEYELDIAVLTSFSLDLETALALPLGVLNQADSDLNELLASPARLLGALQQAGNRIHVFVDHSRIALPTQARSLYAVLESIVHPVRAPNGGAFHPKVWVARFRKESAEPLLRVAVLSRNLTNDRSWDIALVSEAHPGNKRRHRATRDLEELIGTLPELTTEKLFASDRHKIDNLAEELGRTSFPAPTDKGETLEFHALGVDKVRKRPWQPQTDGQRLLAVSPFVNKLGLDAVRGMSSRDCTLVSRQEELDKVPADVLKNWQQVLVLNDAAHDEPEDETAARPSGLHAKMVAVEHGTDVTWYAGSANFTAAAFKGVNVEMVASMTGKRGTPSGKTGFGINRFYESGFEKMCVPYERVERSEDELADEESMKALEALRDRLSEAKLWIDCSESDGGWDWVLDGGISWPKNIEVSVWPVTLRSEYSKRPPFPLSWRLPVSQLSAFTVFKLSSTDGRKQELTLVLKLPISGLPENRMSEVFRTFIDSPERLIMFLKALLGDFASIDALDEPANSPADASEAWGAWGASGGLLEDLMRAASRDPARLDSLRTIIRDLQKLEGDQGVVPPQLVAVWDAIDAALGIQERDGAS